MKLHVLELTPTESTSCVKTLEKLLKLARSGEVVALFTAWGYREGGSGWHVDFEKCSRPATLIGEVYIGAANIAQSIESYNKPVDAPDAEDP